MNDPQMDADGRRWTQNRNETIRRSNRSIVQGCCMSSPIGHLAKLAHKLAIKALLVRERLESGVSYHPGSAEILGDPYPKYAQMRQRDPVHRMRLLDGWALTRYKDCDAVLRDHARFSNAIPSEVREQTGLISMLHQDPPEHTRLRALVSQAFTPRAIEKLRFRVEQTAEQLLDAVAGQPSFDLIASLAYPLPITIIADMMGVPPKDMDRFKDWSNDLALSVEPFLPEDAIERVGRAAEELTEYFEAIIAVRRQEPRDDLISVLLAAEEEGSKLTHDRTHQDADSAAGCRERNDSEPDRQWHVGAAVEPGSTATPVGQPGLAEFSRQGTFALRPASPARRAGRESRWGDWRQAHSHRATGHFLDRSGQPRPSSF